MTMFQNETRQSSPRWAWLFVAGPAVWSVYFWMEARAGEMGCPVNAWPLMTWAVLALAGLIMVTMAYNAARSQRSARHARQPAKDVMRDGFLLGACLLTASVLVGVPTLLSQPC